MARQLSALESRGLSWVTETYPKFRMAAELRRGLGVRTLDKLVALGLVQKADAQSSRSKVGYRTAPQGWRTMYGMTYEELLVDQQSQSVDPLRVWWRPVQPTDSAADFSCSR